MDKMGPEIIQLSVDDLKNAVKMPMLEAFSEDSVLDKLKHVIKPFIEPYKQALKTANAKIDPLKTKRPVSRPLLLDFPMKMII